MAGTLPFNDSINEFEINKSCIKYRQKYKSSHIWSNAITILKYSIKLKYIKLPETSIDDI